MKNIACLELMTSKEVSRLSESDLADLDKRLKDAKNLVTSLRSKLDDALAAKYKSRIREELAARGKSHGSISWTTADGYIVSAAPPRRCSGISRN